MNKSGVRRFAIGCLAATLPGPAPLASAQGGPQPLSPASTFNRERAAHLLRRAGFGGTPEQIEHLHSLGLTKAVDYLVDYGRIPQEHADLVPLDPPDRLEMRRQMRELGEEQQAELRQRLERLNRWQVHDLRAWWLQRMAVTTRPFEEKMTLFWHGHFTTGAREVRAADYLAGQNDFLRRHALARYRTLLMGISKDPAMLVYLDNASNRKGKPNENYARELLELFTLGEGNYTERDILHAARALTGWTVGPRGFRFAARTHDHGEKTFLGRTGYFDGEDLIDIILEQPAASRFIAEKLLKFFACEEPAPGLTEALAAELRRNRFDFRRTMKALFRSEAFYADTHAHNMVKSPVELVVGTARMLENPIQDLDAAVAALAAMGQELYQPPNVKGWDGGRKWINTATLFVRYNFASDLLRGSPPRAGQRMRMLEQRRARMMEDLEDHMEQYPGMRIPDRQATSSRQPPFDPAAILERSHLGTAEEVVNHFVARLLQRRIADDRREALLHTLTGGGDEFDATRDRRRVVTLINVILNMPEYQLN